MGWYIENNDLEGAVERWLKTNARWKMEWFDTCKEIFDNCKEWAKTYIVNPIDYSIKRLLIDSINTIQISGRLKEIINNPKNYSIFK